MSRVGVVAALLVVAGWAYWFVPWLTEDRPALVSTPGPYAYGKPYELALEPGRRACLDSIVFTPDTEVAQIRVFTHGRPAVPLRVTASGEHGYRAENVLTRYLDGQEAAIPLRTPRDEEFGELCVRNDGRQPIALAGTQEVKTAARGVTRVDGTEAPADLSVLFFEAGDRSVASRLGWFADRIALWKPGGPALVWLLGVLVLAGMPAGVLWAFASSVEEE